MARFKPAVDALFARLQKLSGVKTFERRMIPVESLLDVKLPALMLITDKISPVAETSMPDVFVLTAEVHIAARADRTSDPPDEVLLGIVDQLSDLLNLQPGERGVLTAGQNETTLDGAVRRAAFGGDIDFYPSSVKDASVVVVPIDLLITD